MTNIAKNMNIYTTCSIMFYLYILKIKERMKEVESDTSVD
jgi:hypothetical protein